MMGESRISLLRAIKVFDVGRSGPLNYHIDFCGAKRRVPPACAVNMDAMRSVKIKWQFYSVYAHKFCNKYLFIYIF